MKPFILILICILMMNCNDNNDCCTVINTDIGLEYINEKGEDLLSPNTENHYNKNDMKVFYLVDGEKKEIFRGNLANPKMLSLSPPHSERDYYIISLSLNDLSTEKVKTTYLQLNKNETDTITHSLKQINNNNVIIDKVWYNGNLSTEGHTFKIMK